MNTKFKTGSILGSLVLKLAIILMILLVASYLRLRLDFSKNRLYSLSKTSREAVKNLKDNMVVKLYTSQELPAQMSSIDRYVKDLLSEYQNAGKGRFHYEFVRNL
ncbi:MAG TPA: Gldg family protein, partial [Candidatus Cloacimonadota bacterium]|nr:Gldg family protein [Candidatus Cloacimonadota bacterium]